MTTTKTQNERQKPATVIDVAKEADVAVGTVSRYLSGETLRRGNREKISNAIIKLGYTRNALAAAMKSGKTNTIGFMVPSLSPYHSDILERFSRMAQRAGLLVLTYLHDPDKNSVQDGVSFMMSHQIKTLIIDGYSIRKVDTSALSDAGVKVISYDHGKAYKKFDGVLTDTRVASQRAVQHLVELGHSRIGILAGDLNYPNAVDRLEGYKDALDWAGIAPDPDLMLEGDWVEHSGGQNARQLMLLDEPPTAIFSCNVSMTVGALLTIGELGLKIPEDVSLISFDDVPLFSVVAGGITAIQQPTEKVAEQLFRMLNEDETKLAAKDSARLSVLECQIVLRSSTRPLGATTLKKK